MIPKNMYFLTSLGISVWGEKVGDKTDKLQTHIHDILVAGLYHMRLNVEN